MKAIVDLENCDPYDPGFRAERKRLRALRAHALEDILFDIASDEGEVSFARIAAAEKLHKIVEPPVLRTANLQIEAAADASGDIKVKDPVAAAAAYAKLINGE